MPRPILLGVRAPLLPKRQRPWPMGKTPPPDLPPPAGPVGEWAEITPSSYFGFAVKLLPNGTNPSGPFLESDITSAVDPKSVIPPGIFSTALDGEIGEVWFPPNGHSNITSSAFQKYDLDTGVVTNHGAWWRPTSPLGSGDNFYESGFPIYGWWDGTKKWRKNGHHTWGAGMQYHPVYGVIALAAGVHSWTGTSPNATLSPKPTNVGLVISRYNFASGYSETVSPEGVDIDALSMASARATLSEYDHKNGVMLVVGAFTTFVHLRNFVAGANASTPGTFVDIGDINGNGMTFATGNNGGTEFRYLEDGKFLVFTPDWIDGSGRAPVALYNNNTSSAVFGKFGAIAARTFSYISDDLTSGFISGSGKKVFVHIDRRERVVWWAKWQSSPKNVLLWRSSFDDITNLTQVSVNAGTLDWTSINGATVGDYTFGALRTYKGSAWFMPRGMVGEDYTHLWRATISNPIAPTFESFDVTFTTNMGYRPTSGKHHNYAFCPLDNKVYFVGGDVTQNYSQEMFTWDISRSGGNKGNGWSQIQNECGADPGGNDNGVRPMNPDDAGWYWDGGINKFWFFWGGGGFSQSGTPRCDQPTAVQIEAAMDAHPGDEYAGHAAVNALSRWKMYVFFTYDPVTGTWEEKTFTQAGTGWNTTNWAAAYGGDSSRGNAFDPVKRKFYRFFGGGNAQLAEFDLATLTAKVYAVALLANGNVWEAWNPSSGVSSFSLGQHAFAIDPTNGRMYLVNPFTGRLSYIDTRGTPILHDRGPMYRLPIYELANDLPVHGNTGYDPTPSNWTPMRIWRDGILYAWKDMTTAGENGKVGGAYWRPLRNIESASWQQVTWDANFRAKSWSTNALPDGSYFCMAEHEGTTNKAWLFR